jgi:predicted TIM-barrel fold metal-dependent hydrolase
MLPPARVIDLALDLPSADHAKWCVEQMDRRGVGCAMAAVDAGDRELLHALAEHPGRLFACLELDPNRGMAALRRLEYACARFPVVAAGVSPARLSPQVPIDDRRLYPLYGKCVELDLAVCVDTGVPRERVPMLAQHVRRVDEVCAFFPEVRFVMRGGAEPWTRLAVSLLRRWPNLFYLGEPLPAAIADYACADGAGKVLRSRAATAEQARRVFRIPA